MTRICTQAKADLEDSQLSQKDVEQRVERLAEILQSERANSVLDRLDLLADKGKHLIALYKQY
jgi:hypothetical protein